MLMAPTISNEDSSCCLSLFRLSIWGTAEHPAQPKDPLNRESPQSSVFAFLEAVRAHDYARAARYLDLRKLPQDQRWKQGADLARQLGQILNRDSQFDVAELSLDSGRRSDDSLPADRERVDSFNS